MRFRIPVLLTSAALVLTACISTPDGPDGPSASIAEITDQATLDKLVKAAREEGRVVWYTSVPSERAQQIADMFTKEYDIEVVVQRSGGNDILQRYLLEKEAKRVQNDVLTISDPAAFINLQKENDLTCFKPRNFADVPTYAKDAGGCWISTRTNAMVMAYNTEQVTEPPTGWDDIVNPRFSGDLAYVDPNFSSGSLIVTAGLANDLGWEWFDKLKAEQPFIVKSNNQLMETVVLGERGVAAFVNSTYVAEAKAKGQPVEWVFPEDGVYLVAAPSAVVSGAPNPAAGKLLADFLLTEAVQQLMIEDGNYAAVDGMAPPEGQPAIEDMNVLDIDYDKIAKDGGSVRDQFNSLIGSAN
jgi:iron(III) transport system substrate-binding protein